MASFLNTSIMSNVGQMMSMGQDVMKYARQAVKGMGQDARFFRDSKKGSYKKKLFCTQRKNKCKSSFSPPPPTLTHTHAHLATPEPRFLYLQERLENSVWNSSPPIWTL